MKTMDAVAYKEFRKLLYDYGNYDLWEIVSPLSKGAYVKQKAMLKALCDFEKRHGHPGRLLHENEKDLKTYSVLSRIEEYTNKSHRIWK